MSIINKNLKFYTYVNFKKLSQKRINFLIFKTFCGKLTKKGKKLKANALVQKIFLNLRQIHFNLVRKKELEFFYFLQAVYNKIQLVQKENIDFNSENVSDLKKLTAFKKKFFYFLKKNKKIKLFLLKNKIKKEKEKKKILNSIKSKKKISIDKNFLKLQKKKIQIIKNNILIYTKQKLKNLQKKQKKKKN